MIHETSNCLGPLHVLYFEKHRKRYIEAELYVNVPTGSFQRGFVTLLKIPFSQDYKAAHGAIKQLIRFSRVLREKKVLPRVYVSANCSRITSLTKRKKNKHNYV